MEQARQNARSALKHWIIVINNPTDADQAQLDALKPLSNYWVIGREHGESGTPHLQCFFSLKKALRRSALSALVPRAFLDRANGTPKQASDYCKKDGLFSEGGDLSTCLQRGAGSTAARTQAYAHTIECAKKRQFDEIEPGLLLRHYSAIKRIAQDHPANPPDAPNVTGHWYYGPPRTGKSATARYENPGFYDKPCNKWWDGYNGQDTVIIDDFDLNHKVLGHHVKRWLDRYSFPAEVKGTTIQIRPLKVIITSNYEPEEIWHEDPTLAEAVRARCQFKHFSADNPYRPPIREPLTDAQRLPTLSLTSLYCEETQLIDEEPLVSEDENSIPFGQARDENA